MGGWAGGGVRRAQALLLLSDRARVRMARWCVIGSVGLTRLITISSTTLSVRCCMNRPAQAADQTSTAQHSARASPRVALVAAALLVTCKGCVFRSALPSTSLTFFQEPRLRQALAGSESAPTRLSKHRLAVTGHQFARSVKGLRDEACTRPCSWTRHPFRACVPLPLIRTIAVADFPPLSCVEEVCAGRFFSSLVSGVSLVKPTYLLAVGEIDKRMARFRRTLRARITRRRRSGLC